MKQRKKIEKIIEMLEKLGKEYDYRNLELAIAIYLRGDLSSYDDETLEEIDNVIYDYDGSLLNDEIKDYIDSL